MGMKIYGCLAAENPDNVEETIKIAGIDTSKLGPLVDEHHDEPSFFDTIGAITYHAKLFSEADCKTDLQRRAWNRVKVPMLYIEGELADDTDHPNAKSAASLIKFCQRPEIPVNVGLSIDGGIIEKTDHNGTPSEDGSILAKTVALRGSLTVKPCNSKCFLAPVNDLTKSDLKLPPPQRYWSALQKSQSKSSFNVVVGLEVELYVKLNKLKKSIVDFNGSFTSLRCKKCGEGLRFFKSSTDLPNGCSKCGNHFSMSEIWQSLNK